MLPPVGKTVWVLLIYDDPILDRLKFVLPLVNTGQFTRCIDVGLCPLLGGGYVVKYERML